MLTTHIPGRQWAAPTFGKLGHNYCACGGVVSVEGGFHGDDEVWRGCGVEDEGQLAVFEKTGGGELLAGCQQ